MMMAMTMITMTVLLPTPHGRETRESFNSDESEQLLRGFLSKALFDNGLYAPAAPRRNPAFFGFD